MSIKKIRIIQTADMQYKNRTHNLENCYESTSEDIEKILIDTKADIYAFVGDFTEYPTPNDSERSLMFKHLGNVLNINSLKEIVVMNGNHDLIVGKKIELSQKENNPLDTFVKSTKAINPELFKKINYLKKQQEYESIFSDLISWVSYSLEDGSSTGSNLVLNQKNDKKYRIPVFHDILRQYVDDKKLPISKNKYDYLMNLEDFATNPNQKALILGGDIHENYSVLFPNDNNIGSKYFIYPGSPIQRNHGEGSYYKVKSSGPQIIYADKKVVKQIDLYIDEENIDNSYYEVEDIVLPSTLEYIKIDLNNKKFVENWKEQLTHLISNIKTSNQVNIIKLEISNIYMKYEMEILSLVNDFFDARNKENGSINHIELSYGTVIFDKDELIIDDEVKELDEDGEEIENEEIVLNQDKLILIFEKILKANNQNILKEFTNPEEFNEIIEEIQSLFEEQIETSYTNKTSYHTDFERINIAHGFMALGPNDINLNIPGITRIDGNNGIGKTTLLNILRWMIKGTVLDGLPKNTKKDNLLLVFNYELWEQDYLNNVLYLKVNDIPVEIERNARRTWKKSATEENKKSLEWKSFIDTATTTLTLRVYPKDKEVVVKMNDDAQNLIDQWFGNTIETIFILNQFKILQLLNSPGDTLKETVLEYIGVDYLKSLIGNLELVKPNYVVAKPEKAQMDIIVEKNKTIQTIDEGKIKINDMSELIKNNLEIKNISENSVTAKNQQLLDLGNVPEIIKKIETELQSNKDLLSSFEIKTIKTLPIFEEVEPVKPTLILEELTKSKEEVETKKLNVKTEFDTNVTTFDNLKTNKLSVINENIVKLDDALTVMVNNMSTTFSEDVTRISGELTTLKKKHYDDVIVLFDNNIKEASDKLTKANGLSNENKQEINLLIVRNNTIKSEIDNDICSGCKRPIGLTEEDIKTKNLEIEENKVKVNGLNEKQKSIDKDISDANFDKKGYEEKKNNFLTILNWKNLYTSYEDFVSEEKIIVNSLDLFEPEIEEKIIRLLNDGMKAWEVKNNFKDTEEYKTNRDTKEKFNKLLTVLATLNINTTLTEELRNIKFISDLFINIDSNKTLSESLVQIETELKDINNKITSTNNEYNVSINVFNTTKSKHNDDVMKINTENTQIIDHNKLQIEYENNIKRLENDFNEQSSNSYLFDKYRNDLTELNDGLKKLNDDVENWRTQINTLEKNEILYQENLVQLNKLEDDWKKYRKKNFIYKTYEKLIKNDFKYAIFNYYRTFLNNRLNLLLEGLNFRLYWNSDSNLYMVKISKGNDGLTSMTYIPVKLASGMQTAFLGLSLIYSFHLLNVRNSISHIFIDEISGQLNSGKNKGVEEDEIIDEATKKNYQEQLVMLLSRFDKKKVFIIDHVIDNLYETHTYNAVRQDIDGNIVTIYK